MGLFDSVYVDCPHCGNKLEHQSKADDPYCRSFTIETAPEPILWDILNDPKFCRKCGNWSALVDPQYPPGWRQTRPKPKLECKKLLPPEKTSEGAYTRYWDSDFTAEHIVDFKPANEA